MSALTDVATLTVQLYNAHCHLWNEVPLAYNDIGSDISNDVGETWCIKSASLLLSFMSLEDATSAFRQHYKQHGVGASAWTKFIDDIEAGLDSEESK